MDNTHQTFNKRKFERIAVQLLVDYSDGIHFYSDIIHDISIGGLRIESLRELPTGTRLTLTIPTLPPSKVQGEIMWSKKKGIRHNMGIKFVNLKQEQEWQIKEIIKARAMENIIL